MGSIYARHCIGILVERIFPSQSSFTSPFLLPLVLKFPAGIVLLDSEAS